MSHPDTIDLGQLPGRRVQRLRMLVICRDSHGRPLPLVGVDDHDGMFVQLEDIPAIPSPTVCDLSRDGRKILFKASEHDLSTPTRLCVLDLPTAQTLWIELSGSVTRDTVAAFSPDGRRLAILSSADKRASVDVLDLTAGTAIRLWTADDESWSSWESSITWSPDGELLAATIQWFDYENTDDDWDAVVVIGAADGRVRNRYNFRGHAGWFNSRDLALLNADPEATWVELANQALGTTQPVPNVPWEPDHSGGGTAGVLNDRIVLSLSTNDPTTAFFHVDRRGQDRKPVFATKTRGVRVLFAADTDPLGLANQTHDGPDRR